MAFASAGAPVVARARAAPWTEAHAQPCAPPRKSRRPARQQQQLRSSFLPSTRLAAPLRLPCGRSVIRPGPAPSTAPRASAGGPHWETLKERLGDIPVTADPGQVAQKSKDYFWYSPILKEQLTGKVGDFVAAPRNEEEVIRVLDACRQLRIPVTARGWGTGNYGQAVPLARGCVLDLSGLDRLLWCKDGAARVQAGMKLVDLEAQTVPLGWELRFHPSTRRTASIGGFVAGGSGGVGSINYGGLRDPGNLRALRVVTMGTADEPPKAVELRGPDCLKVAHAYGTNGIITEVELPLAPATKWSDVVFSFPDLNSAVAFGERLGRADGVRKKLLSVLPAPLAKYFPQSTRAAPDPDPGPGPGPGASLCLEPVPLGNEISVRSLELILSNNPPRGPAPAPPRPFAAPLCASAATPSDLRVIPGQLALDASRAHVFAMLEAGAEPDARALAAAFDQATVQAAASPVLSPTPKCAHLADAFDQATVERCGPTPGDDARGALPLFEFAWNHTTLHALKYDKDVTYLQSFFPPGDLPSKVAEMEALFKDEVYPHLEFARVDGQLACFGLQLVRYTTAARLQEIIDAHERAGVTVFNPHTYLLEDGGMKQVDEEQLGYKLEADPLGLLNPGKMRAWEERYGSAAPPPPPAPVSTAADPSFTLFASPAAPAPAAAAAAGAKQQQASSSSSSSSSAPAPIPGFEAMHRGGRRRWRWEEFTTREFHEMDMARAVAVIPVGAVEQHGPHLPVAVDALLATRSLDRALEVAGEAWGVPLLALPPVCVGKSNEVRSAPPHPSPKLELPLLQEASILRQHAAFAGTLTLSAETLTRLLTDLVESVHRAGVRKVVLLNSHGGQPQPPAPGPGSRLLRPRPARPRRQVLDIVARDARQRLSMLVVRCNVYAMWATDKLWPPEEVRWGIHGGGIETSIMLHLRPDLVQMEHARDFRSRGRDRHAGDRWLHPHSSIGYGWLTQDLSPDGAIGDATDADAERGRAVLEQSARDLVTFFEEVHRFDVGALEAGTAFSDLGGAYRDPGLD
eukprot:tig00001017_g6252.t1